MSSIVASVPNGKSKRIWVEVQDTFTTGDGRKVAHVRALDGQWFSSWTHGGWCASQYATIRADLLKDVTTTDGPAFTHVAHHDQEAQR